MSGCKSLQVYCQHQANQYRNKEHYLFCCFSFTDVDSLLHDLCFVFFVLKCVCVLYSFALMTQRCYHDSPVAKILALLNQSFRTG